MKQIWLCMLSKAIILAQEIGIAGLTAIRGIATATMTSNQYRIISFQPSTTLRIGTPENNDGPDISKWISMKYSKGSHISLLDVLWSAGMEQLFIEEKNWNSKTPTVALKKRVMSILRVWCPFSGCWALLQWWRPCPGRMFGPWPSRPFQRTDQTGTFGAFDVEACKSSGQGWNDYRISKTAGVCFRSPWGNDSSATAQLAQDLDLRKCTFGLSESFLGSIARKLDWFVPIHFSRINYCSNGMNDNYCSQRKSGGIFLSNWSTLSNRLLVWVASSNAILPT